MHDHSRDLEERSGRDAGRRPAAARRRRRPRRRPTCPSDLAGDDLAAAAARRPAAGLGRRACSHEAASRARRRRRRAPTRAPRRPGRGARPARAAPSTRRELAAATRPAPRPCSRALAETRRPRPPPRAAAPRRAPSAPPLPTAARRCSTRPCSDAATARDRRATGALRSVTEAHAVRDARVDADARPTCGGRRCADAARPRHPAARRCSPARRRAAVAPPRPGRRAHAADAPPRTELAEPTARADELPRERRALAAPAAARPTARAARHEALTLALEPPRRRRHDAAARPGRRRGRGWPRSADAHRDGPRRTPLTAREQRQDAVARRLAGMAAELAGELADGDAVPGLRQHRPPRARAAGRRRGHRGRPGGRRDRGRRGSPSALDARRRRSADAEHRRDGLAAAAEGRRRRRRGGRGRRGSPTTLADAERPRTTRERRRRRRSTRAPPSWQLDAPARQATVAADAGRPAADGRRPARTTVARRGAPSWPTATPTRQRAAGRPSRGLRRCADRGRAASGAPRTADAGRRARGGRCAARPTTRPRSTASTRVDAARAAVLDPATQQRRLRDRLAERDRAPRRGPGGPRRRRRAATVDAATDRTSPRPGCAELAARRGGGRARPRARLPPRRGAASRPSPPSSTGSTAAARRLGAAARRVAARRVDVPAGARAWAATTSCRCGSPPTCWPPGSTRSSTRPTSGSATCATSATSSSAPAAPPARAAQAGLGLEVVDQWTGDVRDPATLSGGETFVVSLSLALGLADVVTQEAGGTEIETLFVDEGFGTLDADTLDDVMDRLDGLRAGGRTVGVVSHVSELRSRIPTQVHVRQGAARARRSRVAHPRRHERRPARRRARWSRSSTSTACSPTSGTGCTTSTERPKDWRAFFAGAADDPLLAEGERRGPRRWPRSTTSSTSPAAPSGCAGTPRPGSPATTCPRASCTCARATTTGRPASSRSRCCAGSPRPRTVAVLVDDDPRVLRRGPGGRLRRTARRPGWASTPRCARRRRATGAPDRRHAGSPDGDRSRRAA